MTTYSETEVKFYTPDLNAVAQQLDRLGAALTVPRVYERNVRYEDADKSLSGRGIVVRLRQDNRVWLTYKEPPSVRPAAHDVSHRFEAEVEVSDFDTMALILGRLGYHPHLIYEKYRTTYHMDAVEIVLDEMPFGHFIEIEGTPEDIDAVVQKLGLHGAPRILTNYIALFERVRQRLGLAFTDLTFANFAQIKVPGHLFTSAGNEDMILP